MKWRLGICYTIVFAVFPICLKHSVVKRQEWQLIVCTWLLSHLIRTCPAWASSSIMFWRIKLVLSYKNYAAPKSPCHSVIGNKIFVIKYNQAVDLLILDGRELFLSKQSFCGFSPNVCTKELKCESNVLWPSLLTLSQAESKEKVKRRILERLWISVELTHTLWREIELLNT